jgi:hypothetical protein
MRGQYQSKRLMTCSGAGGKLKGPLILLEES